MSKNRTHGLIWHRLRRGLCGVLCLALLLGLLPAGTVLPAEAAHWAEPYAQQLVDWGVMRGDVNGNLNLGSAITRAEFVTLINRAYGYDVLGSTPFTDVYSRDWYYEDIGIAYNIGYFKGTSTTKASPKGTLTREQAAVMLSRNLMLQETVGETLGFSDSRSLNDWSRGLIGAAVAEGMISGYTDGSFQPRKAISRGEVAAMLVKAIGTPIQKEGDYALGSVYGNVTINSSGVALRDTVILGNLYLTGGIDLGDVLLENVNVLGRIVISGGGESNAGENSVILRNVKAKELAVDSIDGQFVTVRAEGTTDIPTTNVRTNAYVDDESWPGYGLSYIKLDGEPGTKLQLAGKIKEVRNLTPNSDLQFVQGTAEKVTVDEHATNSTVLVDSGTRVDELNLDVATKVTGNGDIKDLNVDASGSTVEQLPDKIDIRPGIVADINGKEMDHTTAEEASAEPKLLAGYPKVKNIAPATATGVFSTNKAGTVYWAVSAVADGSVSVDDLLENPAYGGNIHEKQAGSVNASKSNTEYTAAISKLQPDGSYYISAVMVDGQGRQSPLKVASFSTPDNTVPAFNKGYPRMTLTTTEIAQVTVMTNKNCQLYWALLPAGSTAPTPQEFKANSISGNLGYGMVDAVKNATQPIKVNRATLQEKTTYDLYLWLNDYDGAHSSKVTKLTFTTLDETPPVVIDLRQTDATDKTAKVTYSLNEPGTLYWAIVTEADYAAGNFMKYDLDTLEARVTVESGTGAIAKGSSKASKAEADISFTISKLNRATTKTTSYVLYYMAKDTDGNYSSPVEVEKIYTLDTDPPTVEQHFTKTQNPKDDTANPFANTDIRLKFSESVQGGTKEDKIFLNLYANVQNALELNDTDAIANARNALASALREHITMYSINRNGSTPQVKERTSDSYTGDDWVIDWRYAEVGMENDGSVVITLPTVSPEPDENNRRSALNLQGGATYYFELKDIYDLAYGRANPMEEGTNTVQLAPFTTVYAQVSLSQGDQYEDVDVTVGTSQVTIDICMQVEPQSTSQVPKTERWEMILWSNVTANIQIYRMVTDKNGTVLKNWEAMGSDLDITVPIGSDKSGRSLYRQAMGGQALPYLNNGDGSMDEDKIYYYGIHFNSVNGNPRKNPIDWGNRIEMSFAIIAGGAGNVNMVGGNVDDNFDSAVGTDKVASIGSARTDTGVGTILTIPKQFIDSTVPSFRTTYPKFTAGSSVINMELNLDRNSGTIYYVVAAAEDLAPITKKGETAVTSANDGRDGSSGWTADKPTYIPTDGTDRDKPANKDVIAFLKDANGNLVNGGYNHPSDNLIINPRQLGPSGESVFYEGTSPTGQPMNSPVKYTGATARINVSGLKPETVYYVYFVLQGDGVNYSEVQCYRVETTELGRPSITVDGVSSVVSMTPDAETELHYALWEQNKLPATIRSAKISYEDADGNDAEMTVLKALVTPLNGRGGETYFDRYATDAQKESVLLRVLGSVTDTGAEPVDTWSIPHVGTAPGVPNHPDYVQEDETVQVDFETLMTSKESRYILVAAVCNRYGNVDNATEYGYGAVQNLTAPDKVVPDYPGVDANGDGYLEPALTNTWDPNNPTASAYDGTVTVTFTENEVYYHNNADGLLYEVWPGKPTTAAEKEKAKNVLDVIGGGAVESDRVSVQLRTGWDGKGVTRSFTFKLKGIRHGEDIVFFQGGRISNGSDFSTTKTLRLIFDATLTSKNYHPDWGTDVSSPGFRVEWK